MKLQDAEKSLIFKALAGSHAYGTHTERSDYDFRGLFTIPADSYSGSTKHRSKFRMTKMIRHITRSWCENRNESRWVDQENKKVDFDGKNMQHCLASQKCHILAFKTRMERNGCCNTSTQKYKSNCEKGIV
jgi:hypothetical protein